MKKVFVTLAIWIPTLLILFATPSEGDFMQTLRVLLPILAMTGTVFIWVRRSPDGGGKD